MPQPTQEDFRWTLKETLADELYFEDYPALAEVVLGSFQPTGNSGVDRAMQEAYASLDTALKKLSRLAVRIGYIGKGDQDVELS